MADPRRVYPPLTPTERLTPEEIAERKRAQAARAAETPVGLSPEELAAARVRATIERRQARQRVRELAISDREREAARRAYVEAERIGCFEQLPVDHGQLLGPAAHARPSAIVEADLPGGGFRGGRPEVRRYEDAHLVDRLHRFNQINDPQHEAALRVLLLHEEADIEPRVAASYKPPGWDNGHEDEAPEPPAITEFRRLLGDCSAAHAWLLHEMCQGIHPGTFRLDSLQSALDALVLRWKIVA